MSTSSEPSCLPLESCQVVLSDSPVAHDGRDKAAQSTWLPDLSILSVTLIWGINIPIIKIGLGRVDPFAFNAVRLVLSAGVLLVLAWRQRRRMDYIPSAVPFRKIVVYGIVVSGFYQLLFLLGVSRTTSGNTALIISTVPMWTAVLARILVNERLAGISWLGLCSAFAGTLVVTLDQGGLSANREHLYGNLFILAGAFSWAWGTVYSRPLLKKMSPLQLSSQAAVIALPLHLLVGAGTIVSSLPALAAPDVSLIVLYSGLLSSGLALAMWNYGVRHAGASHAAVYQYLIPVIAVTTAWLIRSEPVSSGQVFGGVLIIGGLIVMRIGRERQAPEFLRSVN